METTITEATTSAWKSELDSITAGVEDKESQEALTALTAALGPYFDHPERFRAMLGKIQSPIMEADQQDMLTSEEFASLDEVEARLPDGVVLSVL